MPNELDDVTGSGPAPSTTPPPSTGSAGTGAGAAGGAVASPVAASPATTPAMPQTQRDPALDNATVPNDPMPKDSWGAKLYHGVLGALGGSSDYAMARDPQTGKMVVTATKSGPGQQWKRIISGGLAGLAASAQRGTGPGSNMRGLGLGIDAGQQSAQKQDQNQRQNADEDFNAQQKAATANAQHALLTHQIAESTWRLQDEKRKATDGDIDRENTMNKLIATGDASDAGFFPHFQSIVELAKEFPQLHDMQAKGELTAIPHTGADGNIDGIHLYHTPPSWQSQKTTTAVPIETKSIGPDGKIVTKTLTVPPGGMSNGDLVLYMKAQSKDSLDEHHKDVKEENEAEKTKIEASKVPAENAVSYSTVGLNAAKAAQIKSGAIGTDEQPNPRFDAMAQALYQGDILPEDLKRQAKGAGLDPNQLLGRAVQLGNANGHPWSETLIKQENKFASNTHTQAALDGIDRIVGKPGMPGYMQQMMDTAQKAHLGTFGLANSSSLAVQRFFGGTAAKNFNTSVVELRRSIAGLIGNPVLGGSETDKKLQQADEMIGTTPTYENLQGAGRILTNALIAQRQSMVSNNRFLQKRYSGGQVQQQQPAAQPSAGAPTGSIGQIKGSDGRMYWTSNGKTGDLGVAQ